MELTPVQMAVLERLIAHGYTPVAFPLCADTVGVRRDAFAALLAPVAQDGLRLVGEPCYLLDGNLSVLVHRSGRAWFVWKNKSAEATPELLAQRSRFSQEMLHLLSAG